MASFQAPVGPRVGGLSGVHESLVFRWTVWGWACPRKHPPVAVDALDLSSGGVLAVTPSISETWVLALRTPGGSALRSSLAGRGHSPSYLVLGQCPRSTGWGESGSALSLKGGVLTLSLPARELSPAAQLWGH